MSSPSGCSCERRDLTLAREVASFSMPPWAGTIPLAWEVLLNAHMTDPRPHARTHVRYFPYPPTPVYALSKTTLLGMVKALAYELGPSGIRVNGVAPGVIKTKLAGYGLRRTMSSLKSRPSLRRRRHRRTITSHQVPNDRRACQTAQRRDVLKAVGRAARNWGRRPVPVVRCVELYDRREHDGGWRWDAFSALIVASAPIQVAQDSEPTYAALAGRSWPRRTTAHTPRPLAASGRLPAAKRGAPASDADASHGGAATVTAAVPA